MQKILRNGRTVTVFTVGTGGMFDQRVVGDADLPKPAQWHRIAIHNDQLGAFAVQKLVKKYVVSVRRSPFFFSPYKYTTIYHFQVLWLEILFYCGWCCLCSCLISVLQFMLRVILKPEYTMTALMIK